MTDKVKVMFLSDEAIETIKGNIDKFTNIVKANPVYNTLFLNALPDNKYVEKEYTINDFELNYSQDGDYSKVDFDNAITLFENLNDLPKYILCDERFWMWIILEKGYAAAVQAMPMDSGTNIIKAHWLFDNGVKRGLMFGVLSRCFYRVFLTNSKEFDDQYMLTRFATENYQRYRELTWRSYSNNPKIVISVLKAEKKMIDLHGVTIESKTNYYREIAKFVSQLGSVMFLDYMPEDYIQNSVMDFCEQFIKDNSD